MPTQRSWIETILGRLHHPSQMPAAELFMPAGDWAPTKALNTGSVVTQYRTWQTQVLKLVFWLWQIRRPHPPHHRPVLTGVSWIPILTELYDAYCKTSCRNRLPHGLCRRLLLLLLFLLLLLRKANRPQCFDPPASNSKYWDYRQVLLYLTSHICLCDMKHSDSSVIIRIS